MRHTTIFAIGIVLGLVGLGGCDAAGWLGPSDALSVDGPALAEGADKQLDPALCAIEREDFTLDSTNPYFPIGVGSRWSLEGEEDDALIELGIEVLDETVDVGGVTTRVIEERESEDGGLTEVSRNYFAATSDGTVCYFGEDVDIYEDGEVVSHDGAWRADAPGNSPGIMMPADPRPGVKFATEGAPGVAEDEAKIVGIGPVDVPAGSFTATIRQREFNPLDGEKDYKVFAEGVGIVIDGTLSLVEYRIDGLAD